MTRSNVDTRVCVLQAKVYMYCSYTIEHTAKYVYVSLVVISSADSAKLGTKEVSEREETGGAVAHALDADEERKGKREKKIDTPKHPLCLLQVIYSFAPRTNTHSALCLCSDHSH